MAEYTSLSETELQELLAQFGLSATSSVPLSGGRANTSFLVNDRFVLTVCDAKSPREADRVVRLLETMEEAKLPTSRVRRALDGSTTLLHHDRPVVLKAFAKGHVGCLDERQLAQVGVALAQLHACPAPAELDRLFSYGLQSFEEIISWPHAGTFGQWLARERERLRYLEGPEFPRGLIHGDLFWDNIVSNGESIVLLDFEEACHYTLAFDLGMAIVGCCYSAKEPWLPRTRALIAGYQRVRQLSPVEAGALQAFAVYAATATAKWRFWQFNIHLPDSPEREVFQEMRQIAEAIAALDPEHFLSEVFRG